MTAVRWRRYLCLSCGRSAVRVAGPGEIMICGCGTGRPQHRMTDVTSSPSPYALIAVPVPLEG